MPAKPTAPRVNASASRPASNGSAAAATPNGRASAASKAEHKILFQKYFKSIGPRTYAVQVKEANNGNHYMVLTEGKRDAETGEVKKTRVFVYSEDFGQYFRMLHETAQFIKTHPVSEEIKQKRQRYWAKKEAEAATAAREAAERQAAARHAAAASAKPIQPTKLTAPKNGTHKNAVSMQKNGARRPARGR